MVAEIYKNCTRGSTSLEGAKCQILYKFELILTNFIPIYEFILISYFYHIDLLGAHLEIIQLFTHFCCLSSVITTTLSFGW